MQEAIRIENLSSCYKDKKILENCSFSFYEGEVYLLEGHNGCGKSSFIKSLIGLDRKSKIEKGLISILGSKNVLEMGDGEILSLRSKIAYLEQKDFYEAFKGISVFDVLADSFSSYSGHKLTKKDADLIKNFFNRHSNYITFNLKTKVDKLSGGQQRMLSIIATICLRSSSRVFLIDEPLNNLDIDSVAKISNLLNELVKDKNDSVFIIVSHCKIFPFITKTVRFENFRLIEDDGPALCYACFGTPDENGYYCS